MRVLIVEDNEKMAAALERGLATEGYDVRVCVTSGDGRREAATGAYDVIVLDRMLPDGDGVEVCRDLRDRAIRTPVLMLTALSGTGEKAVALEAGADDYLTKPFDFDTLVARIGALLRRDAREGGRVLRHADLKLDLDGGVAHRAGRRIALSGKECALLEFFMRHAGRVLDRQVISEKVWGLRDEPSGNVLDVFMSALRRKIDRDSGAPLIHDAGAGYRFGAADAVS